MSSESNRASPYTAPESSDLPGLRSPGIQVLLGTVIAAIVLGGLATGAFLIFTGLLVAMINVIVPLPSHVLSALPAPIALGALCAGLLAAFLVCRQTWTIARKDAAEHAERVLSGPSGKPEQTHR